MTMTHSTDNQETVITDLAQFFGDISAQYQELEKCYLGLSLKIHSLKPTQIEQECCGIVNKQLKMEESNNKLIEIITLAGQELTNEQMVQEYRVAFARAVIACENLQKELSALKLSL